MTKDEIAYLRQMITVWKNDRAHTYASENADHYRGFDDGQFRAAEQLERFLDIKEKE